MRILSRLTRKDSLTLTTARPAELSSPRNRPYRDNSVLSLRRLQLSRVDHPRSFRPRSDRHPSVVVGQPDDQFARPLDEAAIEHFYVEANSIHSTRGCLNFLPLADHRLNFVIDHAGIVDWNREDIALSKRLSSDEIQSRENILN